jgi:hypothetical protein
VGVPEKGKIRFRPEEMTAAPQPTIAHRLAALAGCAYMRFVGLTTPVRYAGAAPSGQVIYVVWHCNQAFLIYAHRGRNIAALASRSRDGGYVAAFLRRLGYFPVRGSTNKGALRSLMQLMQCARNGYTLAITPDGPRGPARKVQKGALFLAQKTGLPIVAIGNAISSKALARSWDRFQIPLPFGRAAIVYSEPFLVAETDDLDRKAAELEAVLNEAGRRAEEMLDS